MNLMGVLLLVEVATLTVLFIAAINESIILGFCKLRKYTFNSDLELTINGYEWGMKAIIFLGLTTN